MPDNEAPAAPGPAAKFEKAALALIFLLVFACGAATAGRPGLGMDEAIDINSASRVVHWADGLFSRPLSASFSKQSILEAWGSDYRHGPATRVAHAAAWGVFSRFSNDEWFRNVIAFRLGTCVAFAAFAALAALAGFRVGGAWAGIGAAAALVFMPRVFGHARLCATDVIASALFFAAAAAAWKSLAKGFAWTLITGALIAAAMSAKETCFLIAPMYALLLALRRPEKWFYKLIAGLGAAAVLFFAIRPAFWADPALIGKYFNYLLHGRSVESSRAMYFFRQYTFSPPWSYPFYMLLATTPGITLALCLAGYSRVAAKRGAAAAWFCLFGLAVPVFYALPFIPVYDCERLLLPCCGSLAVAAGVGVSRIVALAGNNPGSFLRYIIGLGLLVLIAFPLFNTFPNEYVYFNDISGGIKAEVSRGMDIDYWGVSLDREFAGIMNAALPQGAKVSVLGLNPDNIVFMQRLGVVRKDIKIVDYGDPADAILLGSRPGVFDNFAYYLYRNVKPFAGRRFGGELLIGLYPARGARVR